MTDDIFADPKKDNFTTESPIRAFTDWSAEGSYAVGKGFRPSVAHLPAYLDAMLRVEGWELVQVLYAGEPERRSFIFKTAFDNSHQDAPLPCMGIELASRGDAMAEAIDKMDEARQMSETIAELQTGTGKVRFDGRIPADDPVNPKHYAGTACAEIGERLTANCYQVLKYCWRLGEKDDPVVELGKAIWYAKRELALGRPKNRNHRMGWGFFASLATGKSQFVQEIVGDLYEMTYGFTKEGPWRDRAEMLIKRLDDKLCDYEDTRDAALQAGDLYDGEEE